MGFQCKSIQCFSLAGESGPGNENRQAFSFRFHLVIRSSVRDFNLGMRLKTVIISLMSADAEMQKSSCGAFLSRFEHMQRLSICS